jgi:hypothetical protein
VRLRTAWRLASWCCKGDIIVVRYADDIIVGFEHEREARRFWDAMRDRLREFSLSLHPDRTRLIEFGRRFRCPFRPLRPRGVRSSISSRAAMSMWPSPRVDRLGTPKIPAIRLARAMTFVASWFTHLLRPVSLLAPQYGPDHLRGQRGLLHPGFQQVGRPSRRWI